MDAQIARPVGAPDKLAENRVAVAASILAVSAAVYVLALVVVGRRIVGAVDRPAPAALLLAVAAAMGVFSWLSRRSWRAAVVPHEANATAGTLDAVVGWGPSVAMILLTVGLSYPMERYVDWLVWTPLWVCDVFWRTSFLAGEPFQNVKTSGDAATPASSGVASAVASVADEAADGSSEGLITQQLTRFRSADGGESIAGLVLAEFTPGQRTAELYIGFCPPFGRVPAVELEQSDGPPARVSQGRVLAHGARIEVRLDEPCKAAGFVQVDLFARG